MVLPPFQPIRSSVSGGDGEECELIPIDQLEDRPPKPPETEAPDMSTLLLPGRGRPPPEQYDEEAYQVRVGGGGTGGFIITSFLVSCVLLLRSMSGVHKGSQILHSLDI